MLIWGPQCVFICTVTVIYSLACCDVCCFYYMYSLDLCYVGIIAFRLMLNKVVKCENRQEINILVSYRLVKTYPFPN